MNPIRTNKPVFFKDDGTVLKNGYIYIGQPEQDPIPLANRKTVTFQDSGGSQFTAAQPLRTGSDGRIVYEATGKPIIALVDGDYSMLVQDENGKTIKNGYTPVVENDSDNTVSDTIVYRTTLSDLKAVNVTPGDYVENIGKATAEDREGARWLVVSNTGSGGDDVDLIDFDNGTQGKRIDNQIYTKSALSSTVRAEARSNIDVYSTSEVDQEIKDLADGALGSPTIKAASSDYTTGDEEFSSASGQLAPIQNLGLDAGWYAVYFDDTASEPESNQALVSLFVDPNVGSCATTYFSDANGPVASTTCTYFPSVNGGELRVQEHDGAGSSSYLYVYKVRKDRA